MRFSWPNLACMCTKVLQNPIHSFHLLWSTVEFQRQIHMFTTCCEANQWMYKFWFNFSLSEDCLSQLWRHIIKIHRKSHFIFHSAKTGCGEYNKMNINAPSESLYYYYYYYYYYYHFNTGCFHIGKKAFFKMCVLFYIQ